MFSPVRRAATVNKQKQPIRSSSIQAEEGFKNHVLDRVFFQENPLFHLEWEQPVDIIRGRVSHASKSGHWRARQSSMSTGELYYSSTCQIKMY